jgi:hypothetical protein
LPLSFAFFARNLAEVTSVEDIVRVMEEKYGASERIRAMDRGIVSAVNIGFLPERRARFLNGTVKHWLRHHEAALLDLADLREVQGRLKVRLFESRRHAGRARFPTAELGQTRIAGAWSPASRRCQAAVQNPRNRDPKVDFPKARSGRRRKGPGPAARGGKGLDRIIWLLVM